MLFCRRGEGVEFFLPLRWIVSDLLYAPFKNASFYAVPCLELENEQDSRIQDFLWLNFEKRSFHPNSSIPENLFSLKLS